MEKILNCTTEICLFCGEEKKSKFEEYTQYYECDCKDSLKEKEIQNKIYKLKQQIPNHRFSLSKEYVLRNVEDND